MPVHPTNSPPDNSVPKANAERIQVEIAALLNLGLALHRNGELAQATAAYQRVLSTHPNNFDAWHLSGVIAAQSSNPLRAVELIDEAIKINPKSAAAWANRGNALKILKRLEEALSSYDCAIAMNPHYADAYSNRGAALAELNRMEEALLSYDQAIALAPDSAAAHNNRGNTLKRLSRSEEAFASYDRAIAIKPDYAEAHNNKGNVLEELRRLQEAVDSYDRAIAVKPDYAEAHNYRGVALQKLGRLDEAVESYDGAIAIRPDYAEALNNRGLGLMELRSVMEALSSYDLAISMKPDYGNAHFNKSLALLLVGEFETGWKLWEWRWKKGKLNIGIQTFSEPLWLGHESIQNKTILLHAEQGLGDTIQFCRYAKLVKELGATVLLEVPKTFWGLLRNTGFADLLVERGKGSPAFDYHCPLMSLPLAFGTKLSSVPMPSAYLFADDHKVSYWRKKIAVNATGRLKVGLIWSSGTHVNQPEAWEAYARRNIPLDVLARTLSTVNADFFSLQKGDPAESAIRGREREYWPHRNFYNYASELKDFSDTAALVENLDVIVSVDTSTAHLSGALGKPTWILCPFAACWRWLLGRDDSPWYRSVKLYRQSGDRRWESVLSTVADDLLALSNSKSRE